MEFFTALRMVIRGFFGISSAAAHQNEAKRISPLALATAIILILCIFLGSIATIVYTVIH